MALGDGGPGGQHHPAAYGEWCAPRRGRNHPRMLMQAHANASAVRSQCLPLPAPCTPAHLSAPQRTPARPSAPKSTPAHPCTRLLLRPGGNGVGQAPLPLASPCRPAHAAPGRACVQLHAAALNAVPGRRWVCKAGVIQGRTRSALHRPRAPQRPPPSCVCRLPRWPWWRRRRPRGWDGCGALRLRGRGGAAAAGVQVLAGHALRPALPPRGLRGPPRRRRRRHRWASAGLSTSHRL